MGGIEAIVEIVARDTRVEIGARQQPALDASAYAMIRKARDDRAVLNTLWPKLTEAGKGTLEEAGLTGADQQEFLQILYAAVIGVQQQEATAKGNQQRFDETMLVVSDMKNGLRDTIKQIDSAFKQTMWMYAVSFYLGVGLIIAATVSAFYGKQLLPVVLGGLGTANTLAFFFTKPPERLQSSRASLAQLQCALLNWFNDFLNRNALMIQISQDQMTSGKEMDPKPYHLLSETLMKHTDEMMRMLQKYCKLVENPSDSAASTPVATPAKPESPAQADATPAPE